MRAAIVLAAGASRRFGRGDKLLAWIGRATLLDRAIAQARASAPSRIVVVVPSGGGRVGRRMRAVGGVRITVAKDHARGLGASLRAGLRALRPIEREALIFLGDMPGAHAPRGLRLRGGIDAVRPMVQGKPGHPVLLRAATARRAITCDDQGVIARLDPARVALVRGGAVQSADIDTVAALRRARRRAAGRRG